MDNNQNSTSNVAVSQDHQRFIVGGLLQSAYLLSVIETEMNDGYFNDGTCKIIYKSVTSYYNKYQKLPTEQELALAIESNFIELGPDINTVKGVAIQLLGQPPVDDQYLLDKCVELIKKVRVSRSLNKTLEMIKNGASLDNEKLAGELIKSLDVSFTKSGLFCLSDREGLAEARRKAMGDNEDKSVIKSIIPSINTSLQYRGYQKGTLNLIVSPPGCFTGDTKIWLPECNRNMTIEELYNKKSKDEFIFNSTPEGRLIVDKFSHVHLSKYVDKLIEVSVNDNPPIKCTEDHPFMLVDGTYKKAEDLKIDDRLMSVQVIKDPTKNYRPEIHVCVSYVKKINKIKLKEKVPVYGIVDAGKEHNYAVMVNDRLGVFVSNTGKTSFLINEGAYASMQGFNVMHVFLGDMVHYDGFVRYSACISGKLQNDITHMTLEEQDKLIEECNKSFPGVLDRVKILAYGAGEINVDTLIENIKREQEKLGVIFDDIIIDYADNFDKDNTDMYNEGGYIYDRLSLFARLNGSVVMVASQPKIGYWKQEIIPLEGAAESSKKQYVVDLMMTFNLVAREANIGTLFIPKVRRGTSGRLIRIKTAWENCRLNEITEEEYTALKGQAGL